MHFKQSLYFYFLTFLSSYQINFSECQTDRIQIRPDLGPNRLQRLSADDTSWQRVSAYYWMYWYIVHL